MRLLLAICLATGAQAATLVSDTLRTAAGTLASGTVTVTAVSVSESGQTLAPTRYAYKIVAGAVGMTLSPGVYTAAYVMSDGASKTCTWTVPATGPVAVREIQACPAMAVAPTTLPYANINGLTAGDILYGGPTGILARLPLGPNGNCIAVISGSLAYGPCGAASGTVTSVGLNLPGLFNVTGSPIISAGVISATLAAQVPNTILAGPSSGSAAAPTFRALAPSDIPAGINTTGNAATASALAAVPTQCGANAFATGVSASGNANCAQPSVSNLSDGSTGSGAVARAISPSLTTPTITSLANAQHDHQNAAGGGPIPAAAVTSGRFAASRNTSINGNGAYFWALGQPNQDFNFSNGVGPNGVSVWLTTLPFSMVVNKISINVGTASGTACTGGTCGALWGIYDSTCTSLLGSSAVMVSGGSPNLNSTGVKSFTFSPGVQLDLGGAYYLAFASDSAAIRYFVNYPYGNWAYTINSNKTRIGGAANAATGNGSSLALPATCGSLTNFQGNNSAYFPNVLLE